jgi:ribosomal-protein-serine acetyltransferase
MTVPREVISTARLRLEPVEPRLADGIWEATSASLPELRPWLSWAGTASLEQTRAFTEGAVETWEAGTDFPFAVLEESHVVGAVGCHRAVLARRIGEVGYWLRTDRTGRGYATEATEAVVRWGFEVLDLERMELRAGVENLASQAVAGRLGFRREGRLRRGCPHPDGGYDCFIYGLLREDLDGVSGPRPAW